MQRNRIVPLVGEIDAWLALAFLALMCIGIIMVYSASIADSYTVYGSPYYIVEREGIWAALGFVAMAVASRIHYSRWDRLALPLICAAGLLLALVLVPHIGTMSNGARRWFTFGSLSLQPSEFVKLALVIYMAAWLRTKGDRVGDRHTFVAFSIIVGLAFALIFLEPDLGTALVVALTMGALYFVAGANVLYLGASGSGAVALAWVLIHHSRYESGRLLAFMNPWSDPTGNGYHTIQALLALGSGGIFGRGLGNSQQKYLLPAPHTDSILAVIGEEWGVVGALIVLMLFVIVAYRGIKIASSAPDTFSRLLATGITSWITIQALMNFAVITSSVPFTGVPLPFVSYGGSSLIISMTAVGILLSISRHAREGRARQNVNHRRGNGRSRVPRAVNHPISAG